ncbi:hypothetical protein K6H09_005454 [Candida tropicalis]
MSLVEGVNSGNSVASTTTDDRNTINFQEPSEINVDEESIETGFNNNEVNKETQTTKDNNFNGNHVGPSTETDTEENYRPGLFGAPQFGYSEIVQAGAAGATTTTSGAGATTTATATGATTATATDETGNELEFISQESNNGVGNNNNAESSDNGINGSNKLTSKNSEELDSMIITEFYSSTIPSSFAFLVTSNVHFTNPTSEESYLNSQSFDFSNDIAHSTSEIKSLIDSHHNTKFTSLAAEIGIIPSTTEPIINVGAQFGITDNMLTTTGTTGTGATDVIGDICPISN